jgi:cytochrome c553
MRSSIKTWLLVLTAVLVFFATTAEAAHIHADSHPSQHSKKNRDSCLICHSAHSTILATKALSCPTPAPVNESVYFFRSHQAFQLEALRLYVRPPPSMI